MVVKLGTRNAELHDLVNLLKEQHAEKVDIVAPATKIRSENGLLVVENAEPIIDENGVTQCDGKYLPTKVADEGVADKLGIPLAYVRRMREDRPDLYDANVNGWLNGKRPRIRTRIGSDPEMLHPGFPADERSFMIRAFRGRDGESGVARAFLSDRYAVMDNLDALTAALDGVSQAGVDVDIDGCDLSERRMYVRIKAPTVQMLAPDLLRGYRSPFSGQTGEENPVVSAGFVISNSEVGSGAFSIVPRLVVEVCNNGLTVTKDALRAVHLGSKLEEGVIRWTHDTESKNLSLITAKARDAVATFLDLDYMRRVINGLQEDAEKELESPEMVEDVTKKLAFDQATRDSVFSMFIKGGDLTAGGVMHAITAAARVQEDPDLAFEMESQATRALSLAAAL